MSDYHPALAIPDDWYWCGACAAGSRRLTSSELAALLHSAATWATAEESTDVVLRGIMEPIEMAWRGGCSCEPEAPSLVPSHRMGVYRLFDANENLLYIGSSSTIGDRVAAHRRKPWGSLVSYVTVQPTDTVQEARLLEAAAIAAEHPRFNLTHQKPWAVSA